MVANWTPVESCMFDETWIRSGSLATSSAVPDGSFWSNALLSATEVSEELPSTNDLRDSLFRKATTNAVKHRNGRISICQGNDFFKFNRFEDNGGKGRYG